MCFPPQRRALFRHPNFQKCSETQVLCTFWLANVLRATTACNFSSLIWPAGSAPAALASLLSTLRSHKSSEKHNASRLSYLFAHLHLLSSDSFSSTLLSSNLSLLSASSLLCFSSVHIVGSLTSKLPSMMNFSLNHWRWTKPLSKTPEGWCPRVHDPRHPKTMTGDNKGGTSAISWAKPHHSLLESIQIKMVQNVPRPKSIGT